jgi:hypothetical protein
MNSKITDQYIFESSMNEFYRKHVKETAKRNPSGGGEAATSKRAGDGPHDAGTRYEAQRRQRSRWRSFDLL